MIRTDLPLFDIPREAQEPYRAFGGGDRRPPPSRDRASHASYLLGALDSLAAERQANITAPGAQGSLVVAAGTDDFEDVASSLGDKRTDAVVVSTTSDSALVHFRTDAEALRRKIETYRTKEARSGQPRNSPLVDRISELHTPTLSELSLEEFGDDDIDPQATYWLELWARGGETEDATERARVREEVLWLARLGDQQSDPPVFAGVERDIYLVRLRGEVLLALPWLVPEVYEVHQAPRVRLIEAVLGGEEAAQPPVPVSPPPPDASVVAVHDTGTSPLHPYLTGPLIASLSCVPGEPEPQDTHGHGTAMSGVAVYSDYLDGIVAGSLSADNRLVSVRLIPNPTTGPQDDDPELWAERTQESVEIAEAAAGDLSVVHSISVGAKNPTGVRTAWSIGVDRLGWNDGRGRLLVVAAGNLEPEELAIDADDYPITNLATPICQPAQAWNAITVGGTTSLTGPAAAGTGIYPPALAPEGGLSPYSATDAGGARPVKPDIVEEAGNTAPGGGLPNTGAEHLSVWTTSHAHERGNLSAQTWATSPAAAATAGALARLASLHPYLGPAALRALYVHSARWTSAMEWQLPDLRDRLRAVGYGAPAFERSASADSNRPIFVHQGLLSPRQGGTADSPIRPIQFIRIPMPPDLVADLGDTAVRLTVTLSYFVEPTESMAGRRYAGGRLRWEMQGPLEDEAALRRRVNKLARDPSTPSAKSSGYDWSIGVQARGRGSLQQDFAHIAASQLAGDRLVAVYPVLGWWEQRQSTWARAIPYALVVSVDLGETDIDLHAAITARATVLA